MNPLVRVEVYGPSSGLKPIKSLIHNVDWANKLVERFNRRQNKKPAGDRAHAIIINFRMIMPTIGDHKRPVLNSILERLQNPST